MMFSVSVVLLCYMNIHHINVFIKYRVTTLQTEKKFRLFQMKVQTR